MILNQLNDLEPALSIHPLPLAGHEGLSMHLVITSAAALKGAVEHSLTDLRDQKGPTLFAFDFPSQSWMIMD